MKKIVFSAVLMYSILFSLHLMAEGPTPGAPPQAPEKAAENPQFEKAYDLYNQAKYDEAIGLFEEVLKADPNHLRAQVYYGVCFMGKDQFDRAIEELQKALKMDDKFPLTNYGLAVCYARKTNPDAGKADEYLAFSKKYGYQVPIWFEQYVERLKSGKVPPQQATQS